MARIVPSQLIRKPSRSNSMNFEKSRAIALLSCAAQEVRLTSRHVTRPATPLALCTDGPSVSMSHLSFARTGNGCAESMRNCQEPQQHARSHESRVSGSAAKSAPHARADDNLRRSFMSACCLHACWWRVHRPSATGR
eukprot:3972534-Prymnesium_polylepis.2